MDVFHVFHQVEWRDEVRHHFEKLKSEGTCIHRLDDELLKRRREELRLAKKHGHTKRMNFLYIVTTSKDIKIRQPFKNPYN